MKKTFQAYALDSKGALTPHTHPVFQGECAYDLAAGEEITTCPVNDNREFTDSGKLLTAISDYLREAPDAFSPGEFIILEKISIEGGGRTAPVKAKSTKFKKSNSKS